MDSIPLNPREFYSHAGLEPIPLKPNSKVCDIRGWQQLSLDDLWAHIPPGANVGLRCGHGGFMVIDADNNETAECIMRYLEGKGLTAAGCVTRHGLHFYLRSVIPADFTWRTLKGDGLEGELRARSCYVVAAPSVVDDWEYLLFGNVAAIPVIDWGDVAWMATPPTPEPRPQIVVQGQDHILTTPPSSNVNAMRSFLPSRGALSAGGMLLAAAIRLTPKGQPVDGYRRYATRSEALASLWHQTMNAGLSPREAAAVVGPIPGRSARDLEADARRVYEKIYQSREEYVLLAEQVATFAFPGRADSVRNDAKVLRAAALLTVQKGPGYIQHIGEIARVAGLSQFTTRNAIRRLVKHGAMKRAQRRRWRGYRLP